MLTNFAGYTFKQEALLTRALTHRSSVGVQNYERLEFLGDRILNLCVASLLYRAFPDAPEGELAKRHAGLVQANMLADIATSLNLGPHIMMSTGEEKSGGQAKQSILADVVESLLAAVYLDSNFEEAEKIVIQLWTPRLNAAPLQDAKSMLQEHLQGLKQALPQYDVVGEEGKDHVRQFTVKVSTSKGCATGQGPSKQAAGQAAAAALLLKLKGTA